MKCGKLLMLKFGRNILGSSEKKLLVSAEVQWRTAVKTFGGFVVPQKMVNWSACR
jgi:hypothetical protein